MVWLSEGGFAHMPGNDGILEKKLQAHAQGLFLRKERMHS